MKASYEIPEGCPAYHIFPRSGVISHSLIRLRGPEWLMWLGDSWIGELLPVLWIRPSARAVRHAVPTPAIALWSTSAPWHAHHACPNPEEILGCRVELPVAQFKPTSESCPLGFWQTG
jgi:hypothetical protein